MKELVGLLSLHCEIIINAGAMILDKQQGNITDTAIIAK